jgi:hypothetical protein
MRLSDPALRFTPEPALLLSEKVNKIAGAGELVFLGAEIAGGQVVAAFQPELRAEEDGCSDPAAPANEVLRIFCLCSGALAFHVVEEFVAESQIVSR